MTWQKLGIEFWDEVAVAGLSDAAARTHAEAIGWLYRLEKTPDLFVQRTMLRRFAGTDDPEAAVAELVAARFWRSVPNGWVLVHHGEVIRQSIAAQLAHREKEKLRQRNKRQRSAAKDYDKGIRRDVPTNVGTNTRTNVDPDEPVNVGLGVPGNTDRQSLQTVRSPVENLHQEGNGFPLPQQRSAALSWGDPDLIDPDDDPGGQFDSDNSADAWGRDYTTDDVTDAELAGGRR